MRSAMNKDNIIELVWENDQVVSQSEAQRSPKESALPKYDAALVNHQQQIQQNLFMQEDEMASWLHYPLLDTNFGNDFCPDFLYPPSSAACLISATTSTPVAAVASTSTDTKMTTCEMTVTPSSGGVSSYDRKRKGKYKEPERHTKEAELESAEAKKPVRGSTSTKRSRVAEVHNQSERRRRDRINQKMRALQELIPCCNKSDKASMLEDAIEYLKSLQMQIQMMSMGCNMVPVMFPGVQRYMPPMGMGMNHPILPYPDFFTGAYLPIPQAAAAAEAHIGPRLPMPPCQMPPVTSSPDTSTTPSSCVSKC